MNKSTRPVKVFANQHIDGKWQMAVAHERAEFHGFGLDVEEGDSGFASYSVAIVEVPGGKVILPRADRIEFLDVLMDDVP